MKECKCASCSLARAVRDGKIVNKELTDAFLLGYHYYGMWHTDEELDASYHAEGVDYYAQELIKEDKGNTYFIKVIKKAKE